MSELIDLAMVPVMLICEEALFKEQIECRLKAVIEDMRGEDFAWVELLSLSTNPDFGDYSTTVAIDLAEKPGAAPADVANMIASQMKPPPSVVRTEATGFGFLNIFVRPAAAAEALVSLWRWIEQNLPRQLMHEDVHTWVHRNCSDHKLRSAFYVWQVLSTSREEWAPSVIEDKSLSLRLLTEPEEFAVCLLLHEFPQKTARGIPVGYLYRLSVAVRDGFFWRERIAPFWLDDRENPAATSPRRFLISLCEVVLRTGILNHFQRQRNH